MSWSSSRQTALALSVLGVIVLVGGIAAFFVFYEEATCFDGIQNQDEAGIDCEGKCTKLCEAPRVSALWARSVKVAPGVYHAVAMVQNPETTAGSEALPYTFSLYDANNILIAERHGTMTLEPGEVIPLFEANVITGERIPARTLIEFKQGEWHTMERSANPLTVGSLNLNPEARRLTALVSNTTPVSVPRAVVTALIYGEGDILVAASQTVVTDIPSRGSRETIFTWQEPFAQSAVRAVVTSRLR